jgi:hypothetical protein
MLLGPDATDYLLDLWLTTAMERPDGDLSGLEDIDIALMAGWVNDPSTFVQALVNVRFLDVATNVVTRYNDVATNVVTNGYALHDWLDHNGWAAGSDDRSGSSRFSRMAKTHPELYEELKRKGYNSIGSEEFKRLTTVVTRYNGRSTTVQRPLTNRLSPSPSPSPSPLPKPSFSSSSTTEEVIETADKGVVEEKPKIKKPRPMQVSEAQGLYVRYFGRMNTNQGIGSVLQDICREYPPEQIREAFQAAGAANAKALLWVVNRLKGVESGGARASPIVSKTFAQMSNDNSKQACRDFVEGDDG